MSQGDPVHQIVEKYLAAHPEIKKRQVRHDGEGEYTIDGRPVKVGFCGGGFLVVHDGPLRQPFTDYVEKTEQNQQYHSAGLKNSTLASVPKETRISFGDEGNRYSRLDAMKVAKEQAIFREKAATYLNEGQSLPVDLREKYEKSIDIKLGTARRWAPTPQVQMQAQEHAPANWWQGAPGGPSAPGALPANAAPLSARPMHVPTVAPAVIAGSACQNKANIFGQVPDLFQMANSVRTQPKAMSGTVCAATPFFGRQLTV